MVKLCPYVVAASPEELTILPDIPECKLLVCIRTDGTFMRSAICGGDLTGADTCWFRAHPRLGQVLRAPIDRDG